MDAVVNSYKDNNDIISLERLFNVINSYKYQILGFTTALVIITTLVVFSLDPIYQGTAVVEVEQEKARVVSIEEVYGINGGGDSYLNTQYENFKSRTVLKKVVLKLGLMDNTEFNETLRGEKWYVFFFNWRGWLGIELSEDDESDTVLRDVVSNLGKAIQIEPVTKTQIVRIHARSKNKTLAASIANEIAESYIENYMESKLSVTLGATKWMQGRLDELATNLKQAEGQLQAYRDQENLVDLEGVLTVSSDELRALTKSLVDLKQKLAVSESIASLMKAGKMKKIEDLDSMPAVLAHPVIRDLKSEEAKLERSVQELSKRYGPKHPKMISAKSELISIRDNIRIQTAKIIRGVEKEYEVDKDNEKRIKEELERAKERVQEINRKQFQLLTFEREVQTNKDLYDAFFKRIQETNATIDLQVANAKLVDKAFVPKLPVKPKKELIIILSCLLGLMTSSGIALLLDMLNNSVKSVKDIENRLNVSALGIITKQDNQLKKDMSTLFLDKEHLAFAESIRTIRTGLCLKNIEQDQSVFTITSTQPGEGKSTTAANLALAFGQLGKTLLIDCDMRRPTVGMNFNIKGDVSGLSNLISCNMDKNKCIQNVDCIDVITAGIKPINPQELLASEEFKGLINELKKKYKFIILDSPPVQIVSDAYFIAQVSDGLIYVIEAGAVHSKIASANLARLTSAGISITGVVLNKVSPNDRDIKNSYYEEYY